MESTYIKALEKRAAWLQWGIKDGYSSWNEIGQRYIPGLSSYLKCLQAGETFFMNSKFCNLVDHARLTIPDELVFESSWMQAQQGWMWIEVPFDVPIEVKGKDGDIQKTGRDGIGIRIAAVGWIPVPEGTQTGAYMDSKTPGRVAGKGAYQFLCFQDFSHYNENAKGFGCWSYFMIQEGDKLIDRIRQFEAMAQNEGGAYVDYQVKKDDGQLERAHQRLPDRSVDMMHEIRWVYASMYLMAQRLSVTVTHQTDRNTKRRAERDKRPVTPFVKVVTLRRYEEARKKSERTGEPIDWQFQWLVGSHWRNQYYPSTGEHKPVWIEDFVKGPADKPFKPVGTKVFVARR